MDDLISRSALLDDMKKGLENVVKEDLQKDEYMVIMTSALALKGFVERQPTVEARSVVYGEWEHSFGDEWKCSECGDVIYTEGSWDKPKAKFCEECGADMRKKVQDGRVD